MDFLRTLTSVTYISLIKDQWLSMWYVIELIYIDILSKYIWQVQCHYNAENEYWLLVVANLLVNLLWNQLNPSDYLDYIIWGGKIPPNLDDLRLEKTMLPKSGPCFLVTAPVEGHGRREHSLSARFLSLSQLSSSTLCPRHSFAPIRNYCFRIPV